MIVEPDRLTRWSLRAYFDDKYDVVEAESQDAACRLLAELAADALVIAEDLPEGGADVVEGCARSHNGNVMVVRTITAPPSAATPTATKRLEKPFKLASLAKLLIEEET